MILSRIAHLIKRSPFSGPLKNRSSERAYEVCGIACFFLYDASITYSFYKNRILWTPTFKGYVLETQSPQILFNDGEWPHLGGYVSSQYNSYWSAENRVVVHEVTLYDAKFGMWCAISAAIIRRHIFFQRP